ncbi:MAG TPA: MBL fold metallo-hydrolase [Cytophagales bacterium]|nr:MBL fold metallo-hydrolase [Cytophagales bacterium]HAP62804.1 MBL fold metallo-hydrolase [Cytophagales bacterium]
MAGDDEPDVYAHALTNQYIDRLLNVVQPTIGRRSNRMFGNYLDSTHHINCGIGPFLDNRPSTSRSLLRPTITFEDELEVEIAGLTLQLVHAPGETDDQLFIWMPDKKVLLCGDNYYKTFPNLYTIRGTPYRDVKQWASSLDRMRYLQPEYLVPSHTQPLKGQELIAQTLMDYADAIRFVHDQTIRHMNLGLTAEEIAEVVILPQHLSTTPALQEFYGRVDWSVKSVFTGYMGWFDGNAATLLPLPPQEKADKMAELAGGAEALRAQAEQALAEGEHQWALELTDYLKRLLPEDAGIVDMRYQALTGLAARQSNPNARNYFLSQAVEAKGGSMELVAERTEALVHDIPTEAIFQALAVRTLPEECLDYDKKAVFKFTDTGEEWTVWIRHGVTEIQPFALEKPDFTLTTTTNIWKEVTAGLKTPLATITTGKIKVEGGLAGFRTFFSKFQKS